MPVLEGAAWLSSSPINGVLAWLSTNKSALDALAAVSTTLAGAVAAIGLLLTGIGLLLSSRTSRWDSSRDCLWHFNDEWTDLDASRVKADAALDGMPPYQESEDLDDVLNFFDGMAFMGNRGHLNDELAWSYYYDEARDVWCRAQGYIRRNQDEANDKTLWMEMEPWLVRLERIQRKKRASVDGRRPKPRPPGLCRDESTERAQLVEPSREQDPPV